MLCDGGVSLMINKPARREGATNLSWFSSWVRSDLTGFEAVFEGAVRWGGILLWKGSSRWDGLCRGSWLEDLL